MNTRPGTIVVGIDGSDASKRALQWAAQHAAAAHRDLTIVHAIGTAVPAYVGATLVDLDAANEGLHQSGREVAAAARAEVRRWAPDVRTVELVERADPRELMLELSVGASLVVVGSRGRGRIRSLLLGSVGVALVRHAQCPVVVVRPGNAGTVRNGIVVGVDALPESGPVLEFAYHEASLRDLPLTVLHCRWDVLAGTTEAGAYPGTVADREAERLALAEAVAGMAEKYPDVSVTTRVVDGAPHEVLVDLGERMNLVVVGGHQSHGLTRILVGSVSVAVVEHATCPVAVVPVH